jgi:hypothetical protein
MRIGLGFLVGTALFPASALAGEQIVPLVGEVVAGPPDHVLVPFAVPAGTAEIEVRHDDQSADNILDWGLVDPEGFRGWGGGNDEPAIVGVDAASRSYVPGPITPGTWHLVIGKAKIEVSPATYDVEVVLRTAATLDPQPERTAYVPSDPLVVEARWYAGDFHVHSRESGDARPPLDEIATFARSRGLDFVELSDHNVLTQNDFIVAAQAGHPDLLLIPGMEFTTYAGHANAIGATAWVDHKIGQPDVTIEGAIAAFTDQGALVSINHPMLDLGTFCIGCAWDHEIDPGTIHAIEIATTGLDQAGGLFDDQAIAYWDDLCDAGAHLAALGGSDDHRAGVDLGGFQSPIGDPTTMVHATELSVAGLLQGIRDSRTVVKLQGPGDPMIELDSAWRTSGDTIWADLPVTYDIRVNGGDGLSVHIVRDGIDVEEFTVIGDSIATTIAIASLEAGETRTRVELHDDLGRRVITSNIWQRRCDATRCDDPMEPSDTTAGPSDTTAGTSGAPGSSGGTTAAETTAATDDDASGCGCDTRDRPMHAAWFLLAVGLRRARSRSAA